MFLRVHVTPLSILVRLSQFKCIPDNWHFNDQITKKEIRGFFIWHNQALLNPLKFIPLTVLRRWSRCCSYSVWLCGLYYWTLRVLKSSRALCPHASSFLLAFWSPRLGKRELVCVLLVHLFVLYVLVFVIFLFLLVSGVGCVLWLWHSLDFSINFLNLLHSFPNKSVLVELNDHTCNNGNLIT